MTGNLDLSPFVAAVNADVSDPVPRMLFADFLEEHGWQWWPRRLRRIARPFAVTTPSAVTNLIVGNQSDGLGDGGCGDGGGYGSGYSSISDGGRLNPALSAWLMALPTELLMAAPDEPVRAARRSSRGSATPSSPM